jgi:hypothetical protein
VCTLTNLILVRVTEHGERVPEVTDGGVFGRRGIAQESRVTDSVVVDVVGPGSHLRVGIGRR